MPPKAADKKPASKAPATASKAPEKKDAGKKTAASGDKKKRSKTRKETYSSYIYKGRHLQILDPIQDSIFERVAVVWERQSLRAHQSSSKSILTQAFLIGPCQS